MPRENSFSDEDGRSLTPDLEDIARDAKAHIQVAPGRTSETRPILSMAEDIVSAPAQLAPDSKGITTLTPGDRFRRTVRRVMAMHRTSTLMAQRTIGGEPGVDPRRASAKLRYGNIKQRCVIEVVDYSTVRTSFGRMTNTELIKYLRDHRASHKEPWVRVRWINVGGISYDVISALALKYDMHPLAIEDVLHQRGRSKADYYHKHLFLRVFSHSLGPSDGSATPDDFITTLPRSESPDPYEEGESTDDSHFDDDDRTASGSASGSRYSSPRSTMRKRRHSFQDVENVPMMTREPRSRLTNLQEQDKKLINAANIRLIRELKRDDRVNVTTQPLCIFLFRDGTVLSFSRHANLDYTAPITARLRHRDSLLRTTADPSLLVESLLDLIVDQALEVVEEYQSRILNIEQAVLVKPDVSTVRRLHILQGDLIMHKRTLEPIKTVIYGLRRYDDDRVAALSERVDPHAKIEGFMSHKAKIYLADVHDHMEYILSSLDMFAGVSENLINYTFNMASYEMNEVMRRLTLATIIFLPLTLLTGYFGMNFDSMWSVGHGHTDIIFWIIALPVMFIVIPMFMWSDLKRLYHIRKTSRVLTVLRVLPTS